MKRKFLGLVLASAMSVTLLAGCGNKANDGGAGNSSQKEGKIINIYSWNDEFRQRLEAVYPQVESTSKDGTVFTSSSLYIETETAFFISFRFCIRCCGKQISYHIKYPCISCRI